MSQTTAVGLFVFCILSITGIVFYKTIVTKEWRNRAPGEADSWYLAVFYYNPEDSRLFLPKRTGLGWTINFARPPAILISLLVLGALLSFVSFIRT